MIIPFQVSFWKANDPTPCRDHLQVFHVIRFSSLIPNKRELQLEQGRVFSEGGDVDDGGGGGWGGGEGGGEGGWRC